MDFGRLWNFHNTLGAVDDKHVALKAHNKSESMSYNYKGFFSVVVMAVVDARYRFIFVDIGCNGSCNDAVIFQDTNIYEAIMTKTVELPRPKSLPQNDVPISYFFLGDDAFSLRNWIIKPFPRCGLSYEQLIFNYRFSQAWH